MTLSLAVPRGGAGSATVPTYKVIVNAANPTATLARAQLARLFLKRVTRWDDGEPVRPVDLPPGSAAREAFSVQILGKPAAAVVSFWQQQIFSGRAVPPPEQESDAFVIAYVRAHPGAIGYVSSAAVTADVKVLTVSE